MLEQLKELYTGHKESLAQLPSELLYGHVGYLYCLLFVNAYLPGAIDKSLLEEVSRLTLCVSQGYICDGVAGSRCGFAGRRERERVWHLLSPDVHLAWPALSWSSTRAVRNCLSLVASEPFDCDLPTAPFSVWQLQTESAALPPTVKFLADLQLPSGNFPSSLESCHDDSRHSDRLVHWCHGAPGFIHMLSHAYQVSMATSFTGFNPCLQCLGDGRYLVAAESCGETVWERGLLKKGYGLCHGAAGNAYTFLQLYQLTGHMYHWHRALKVRATQCISLRSCELPQFAEWCLSSDERVTRIPDTPLSLFEGTAGVALFYCDLLTVSSGGKAPFPCLEIPQPKITFSLDAN